MKAAAVREFVDAAIAASETGEWEAFAEYVKREVSKLEREAKEDGRLKGYAEGRHEGWLDWGDPF